MALAIVGFGVLMLSVVAYTASRSRRVASTPRAATARPATASRGTTNATAAAPRMTNAAAPATAPARNEPEQAAPAAASPLAALFCDVIERHKLPPLPTAVTLAMKAMREPYVELERVCRIIATDPALAGRIVSLSRSPLYALRRSPQTLMDATAVLGLSATKRILVTAGMDMLQGGRTAHAERLWHHSLATAIAAHLLVRRTGTGSPDHAYLAGLLHDIGQVVLLRSDEKRFLGCWRTAPDAAAGCDAERAVYGRDHAFIGASILYQWKIDDEIVDAVLAHHSDGANPTVLTVADYVAHRAGFYFVAAPEPPSEDLLASYACESAEAMDATVTELHTALEAELALLR